MTLLSITPVQVGDPGDEDLFNSRFGAVADVINSNIDATNIANNSIGRNHLTTGAVTRAKFETQQAWQNFVYLNNWRTHANLEYGFGGQYFKDSLGIVHMRGLIENTGNAPLGSLITILPEGYRPPMRIIFLGWCGNGRYRIDVSSNGYVQFESNQGTITWHSVANIHFKAVQ